ncbi:MAG: hypothetical protein AAFN77_03775 [Planctomycetota bacterium]
MVAKSIGHRQNERFSHASESQLASKTMDPSNPYSSPEVQNQPAQKPTKGMVPTAVEVGPIIQYAWEAFKQNMGVMIGASLVVIVVGMGISFAQQAVPPLGMIWWILYVVSLVVQTFLGIGLAQIALKVARRESPSFENLFQGGSVFVGVLVTSFVFGIGVTIGLVLLVIPGLILLVMFWPFYYLLVDGKSEMFASLTDARPIAGANVGTTVLLFFATFGIALLGALACGVGLFVAIPFISVIWATAYLAMSGQIRVQ